MCGIFGRASTTPQRPDQLDAVDLLRHRGPDSGGRYVDGGVGLAMRRLAIIDLETGEQPIANETGDVVCVANGEIYNYVELRRELSGRGHVFRTNGDVETIVHLYEELGERCFERLRGMFAVAIWDARRRRLVLGRDRFGIKPLYVAEHGDALLFASEIAPLLAAGVPARPALPALADYLSLGYVPGEETGIEAVRALAPGHALTWSDGRSETCEFAAIEPEPAPSLEEALAEAVRIHLRSDVPLALLLSGGLDSSLIAVLAADELGSGLHTFTVGFGHAAFDELEPARVVARAVGSQHHEVHVRADVAADLPEIVRRLEEPSADPSAIPLYYVCRAAAAEVKVALAGEGGDEVFGGYSRYAWDPRAALVGRLLPTALLAGALERVPAVRSRAARADRKSLVRRAVKLLRFAGLPDAERYFSWFALFGEDAKTAVLAHAAPRRTSDVFASLLAGAPGGLTELGRRQFVDLRTMLAKDLLVKADRMSMAHSLELRVPLLDHRVVAAGLALPDREKVRGVETKRALRRIAAQRLPAEIARRPKQGFEVPIDEWLRGDLAELAGDMLAPERLRRRGIVEPRVVARLLDEHRRRDADHGLRLYALLSLELWFEGVLDRSSVAAGTR